MTKLETDIYNALLVQDGIEKVVDSNPITAHNCEVHAKAAAEVAKRYIENAYTEAYQKANQYRFRAAAINKAYENKIAWLLKNGVTGEVNS